MEKLKDSFGLDMVSVKKHIQECKVAKRELFKVLNNEQRRFSAA